IHFSTKPLQNNTLADLRRNPAVPKAKLSAHPIASKQRRLNHKLSILQRSPQGGGRHGRCGSRSENYRSCKAPETAIAQVTLPAARREPSSRASGPAAASADASDTDG